jgi:hypothetical protein
VGEPVLPLPRASARIPIVALRSTNWVPKQMMSDEDVLASA